MPHVDEKARAYYRKRYQERPDVRECKRQYQHAYLRSPHGRRIYVESHFRKKYGIDFEDLGRMFEAQGGKCPGCEIPLLLDKATHVDHDHATGRVRGLLCRQCNVGLGNLRENPDTFARLLAYLRRPHA